MSYSLQQETLQAPTTTLAKNAHVYRCGELDQTVYFIERGQRVKVSVFFRGREITHPELGRQMLRGVVDQVRDVAKVDIEPRLAELDRGVGALAALGDADTAWVALSDLDSFGVPAPVRKLLDSLQGSLI